MKANIPLHHFLLIGTSIRCKKVYDDASSSANTIVATLKSTLLWCTGIRPQPLLLEDLQVSSHGEK
jgi:hypothetical protein